MDPFKDIRFEEGVALFNAGDFYSAHDRFEDLWHDTDEPERRWLHGIVQLSVALYHNSTGNLNGALLLFSEGISRLTSAIVSPSGLNSEELTSNCIQLVEILRHGKQIDIDKYPHLNINH